VTNISCLGPFKKQAGGPPSACLVRRLAHPPPKLYICQIKSRLDSPISRAWFAGWLFLLEKLNICQTKNGWMAPYRVPGSQAGSSPSKTVHMPNKKQAGWPPSACLVLRLAHPPSNTEHIYQTKNRLDGPLSRAWFAGWLILLQILNIFAKQKTGWMASYLVPGSQAGSSSCKNCIYAKQKIGWMAPYLVPGSQAGTSSCKNCIYAKQKKQAGWPHCVCLIRRLAHSSAKTEHMPNKKQAGWPPCACLVHRL
jgi:hypothetical protein